MEPMVNRRGVLGAEHGYRLLELLGLQGWNVAVIAANPQDVFGGVGIEIRAYHDGHDTIVERGMSVSDGCALRVFERAVGA
jgi:hypothetical protein